MTLPGFISGTAVTVAGVVAGVGLAAAARGALSARRSGHKRRAPGLEQFDQDQISQIMATRPGFARLFIDAIVADLRDKPQVASFTWMTTIAQEHIPGFHQSSIEQLALNSPV